jgi:glycosyltransferase involved in cell wall biosynthesis
LARPRVLHVFKDYWPTPGGVERTIKLLVDGLSSTHDCTVLVNAPGARTRVDVQNGVTVIRAGTLGTVAMTPISPALSHLFRIQPADLVHLHFPNPPGEMSYLWLKRAVPMVLSYHNDLVRPRWAVPLYRPWLRRVLERARRIIVGDRTTCDGSRELRPFRERCAIVPYGVDPARLRPTERTAHVTAVLRQEARSPIALFVGRLRYYKGLDVLIRAARSLDVTVLVVGTGTEEPALRRLTADLGLGERVRFVGAVSEADLPAYYHAADLFVLPSLFRSESFGIAMLEAQACGVPTISTELGTATSVVNRHGESGLVVPPGSVEALTEALAALLHDPAMRSSMGNRARELAGRFTAERTIAETRRVYDEVLGCA